jgi:hypothetical protein
VNTNHTGTVTPVNNKLIPIREKIDDFTSKFLIFRFNLNVFNLLWYSCPWVSATAQELTLEMHQVYDAI